MNKSLAVNAKACLGARPEKPRDFRFCHRMIAVDGIDRLSANSFLLEKKADISIASRRLFCVSKLLSSMRGSLIGRIPPTLSNIAASFLSCGRNLKPRSGILEF
jgi:hypothetical protein